LPLTVLLTASLEPTILPDLSLTMTAPTGVRKQAVRPGVSPFRQLAERGVSFGSTLLNGDFSDAARSLTAPALPSSFHGSLAAKIRLHQRRQPTTQSSTLSRHTPAPFTCCSFPHTLQPARTATGQNDNTADAA